MDMKGVFSSNAFALKAVKSNDIKKTIRVIATTPVLGVTLQESRWTTYGPTYCRVAESLTHTVTAERSNAAIDKNP
jgi:hypothetical protein